LKIKIPENIKDIIPYPPGKPLEELEREYGICDSIKLASNENAWGPSPLALAALTGGLAELNRYPDGSSFYLVSALADKFGLESGQFVLGNGSNEVIEFLVKAFVREGDEVITSHPSFLMYQKIVQVRGGVNFVVPLKDLGHDLTAIAARISSRTRLIFLDNPNNPTGTCIDPEQLRFFLRRVPPGVVVVLDEAYVDFMEPSLRLEPHEFLAREWDGCDVVFLRTFSKAYGLAGLRVGFGMMASELASCLHRVRQPFNINRLAQMGAKAALGDDEHYRKTVEGTRTGLAYLSREVERLGCHGFPSQANFFLIDVRGDADQLYQAMLGKGVIIRSMRAYGFPHFIRVTVGTERENDRFLAALSECLQNLGYV
jgi:histidinol-phosphate aminotransferase